MANKLSNMKIAEVSFCRKGMNQHARVALYKSADRPTGAKAIAKATFEEALQANLTADAVNDAFYESFDGLWERNDAFRCALTDELSAGGDGTVASAAYVASVKALVDEAVTQARQAGASASDTSEVDDALSTAVAKWLETKKEQTMKITNRAELQAAVSKFAVATSTVDDMLAIQKAAKDLNAEDALPADGPLAKGVDPQVIKLDREIKVLKLSPEARTFYDGLAAEDAQTAFLSKSADEQKADIEKAKGDDPVLYKCKDGTELRKSDGAAAVMMAKRLDKQDEELAKLRGDLGSESIEKAAVEKYPHVAKNVAVSMLKSVDTLGKDTDAGKAVIATLDTMEKSGTRLFKTIGGNEGAEQSGPAAISKAQTDFDSKVSEIASRDKIGKADAMSKARVEHPGLWKQAFPDTAEAIEAHEVDQASAG